MSNIKQFLEYGCLKWRKEHERIENILKMYEQLLSQVSEDKISSLTEKDVRKIIKDASKYPFYEELRRDYRIFNLLKKDR